MQHAEQVTFGGAGLDRATGWRGDQKAIDGFWQAEDARVLVLWRGKPLACGDRGETLVWLAVDHPVLADAVDPPVFLGLVGGAPRFAIDISSWKADGDDNLAQDSFWDQSEQVHPAAPTGARFIELRRNMAVLTPEDAELAATSVANFAWHRSHQFCARCGQRTCVLHAGWQRKCGGCSAQHFPRTDPVVIMLVTLGNEVLLGRSPFWPEGMYSLLAGFMEPGETVEAAVRREVLEESNVCIGQVDYLASQPWPFPASLMIGCHAHAASREITIDPTELEDAKWVTREAIMAAWAEPDGRSIAARKGSIANFLIRRWLSDTLD